MTKQLHDDLLLSRREVHEHFGIKERFLEVSAVRGDGPPFIKVGRSVRYRPADVREWIATNRFKSTSEAGQ